MAGFRSKQDIVAEILWRIEEPKTKYQVVQEARSNSRQIDNYLKMMQAAGLVTITANRLVATEKGRELLRLYRQAEQMLGCVTLVAKDAK